MNRGGRHAPIFAVFLGVSAETVEQLGLEVHGLALMPNHYHLLVRSVRGNLSQAVRLPRRRIYARYE